MVNACRSSGYDGNVGMPNSDVAWRASSASFPDIRSLRAAFQKMLPNSGQNKSGTARVRRPATNWSRRCSDSSTRVSPLSLRQFPGYPVFAGDFPEDVAQLRPEQIGHGKSEAARFVLVAQMQRFLHQSLAAEVQTPFGR